MLRAGLCAVVLLFPALALAQQPTMAERNFSAAIQQIVPAATLYAEDMARKLAEKDARIAELEKLCGDPCKTPAAK